MRVKTFNGGLRVGGQELQVRFADIPILDVGALGSADSAFIVNQSRDALLCKAPGEIQIPSPGSGTVYENDGRFNRLFGKYNRTG